MSSLNYDNIDKKMTTVLNILSSEIELLRSEIQALNKRIIILENENKMIEKKMDQHVVFVEKSLENIYLIFEQLKKPFTYFMSKTEKES